jgi:hypothetical protein
VEELGGVDEVVVAVVAGDGAALAEATAVVGADVSDRRRNLSVLSDTIGSHQGRDQAVCHP